MIAYAYGVVAYVVFLLTTVYAVGFVENWWTLRTVDVAAVTGSWPVAMLGNAFLFALFTALHAFLGRPFFKDAWARVLPAGLQRSTHVLLSSVFLMLVLLKWRPIPLELWSLGLNPIGLLLEILSLAGWGLALAATFQFGHFQLFGVAQALAHAHREVLDPLRFDVPFLYRWVRHPIYLGILVAVWSASVMTVGHVLFAGLTTSCVIVLARLEEQDLEREHLEYRKYRALVPMLLPRRRPLEIRRRA